MGCSLLPFAERTTFIRLEVAEGNPTQPFNRDDLRYCLPGAWEQGPVAGVDQEGFLIAEQKLVELDVSLGEKGGNPKDIRGNFVESRHGLTFLVCLTVSEISELRRPPARRGHSHQDNAPRQ